MHVAHQVKRAQESPAESTRPTLLNSSRLMQLVLGTSALLLLLQLCMPRSTAVVGAVRLQQTRHGEGENSQSRSSRHDQGVEYLSSKVTGPRVLPSSMQCSGSVFSKRSCLFSNVCMQLGAQQQQVTAWLIHPRDPQQQAAFLQQHLNWTFHDNELLPNVITKAVLLPPKESDAASSSIIAASRNLKFGSEAAGVSEGWDAAEFVTEHAVTLLWRNVRDNQGSFGHALVNEAFPMFLVLQNHFGPQLPSNLQLLATPTMEHVLHHVIRGTITQQAHLMQQRFADLPEGRKGICFRQLLVGAGGYQRASRASLANSNIYEGYGDVNHHTRFSHEPSFFSSSNWWNFRQHTLQLNGITDISAAAAAQPLVLLNDKRHEHQAKPDRRSIVHVDGVAANISAAFPGAEVQAVRFRDLAWPDQLRLLSRAKVFITTQGSSAFRLVFMPKGSVCIMIGAPEPSGSSVWTSFHELDRWFPLTYMQFTRYEVSVFHEHEYDAKVWPGVWQPDEDEDDGKARRAWWLYNADIRLSMDRLLPMVEAALQP